MRLRFAMLASVLTALAAVSLPGIASAAPVFNHGVTIHVTPNQIVTGDPVLIYGQLNRPNRSNRTIVLYHQIIPGGPFTVIGATRTSGDGFYEFTRAEHVVLTNRSWFVRAPSLPGNVHSRTVFEPVAAAVNLDAVTQAGLSTVVGDTGHPLVFTGHVDPVGYHVGEQVRLQSQEGLSGDDWRNVARGVIGPGSNFSIVHRFAIPGERDLRVLFPGDARNTAGASDVLTVAIEQTQNPTFTINSSAPIIDAGSPATISGTLYLTPATPTSTPVVDPNVAVTLWAKPFDQPTFQPLAHGTTGPDGSYSFTVSPPQNTSYKVTTTFAPPPLRHTAVLYEAVRNLVSIIPSSTSVNVGQRMTFAGTVTPDETGHVIYLERLGRDGDFHVIRISSVQLGSAYRFTWIPGTPGTFVFKTVVPGGHGNAAGHSDPVTITANLPKVQFLPTT